jgi:hypothetical protein
MQLLHVWLETYSDFSLVMFNAKRERLASRSRMSLAPVLVKGLPKYDG